MRGSHAHRAFCQFHARRALTKRRGWPFHRNPECAPMAKPRGRTSPALNPGAEIIRRRPLPAPSTQPSRRPCWPSRRVVSDSTIRVHSSIVLRCSKNRSMRSRPRKVAHELPRCFFVPALGYQTLQSSLDGIKRASFLSISSLRVQREESRIGRGIRHAPLPKPSILAFAVPISRQCSNRVRPLTVTWSFGLLSATLMLRKVCAPKLSRGEWR